MDSIKVDGSLYKCYKCGKGDISAEEVEIIMKVTKHDIAAGICGTPSENLLFYTCDKCK